MKNMLILVCFVALAGLTAWPQATTSSSEKSATKTTGKAETVQGTISQDGTSITADKDNKTWTISNPEAVKGHEGHHVAAKGTVDSAKNEITVSSVKMMAAAKTGEKSEKKTSTY